MLACMSFCYVASTDVDDCFSLSLADAIAWSFLVACILAGVPTPFLADHGWRWYGLGSSCRPYRPHWYYWICELGGHLLLLFVRNILGGGQSLETCLLLATSDYIRVLSLILCRRR